MSEILGALFAVLVGFLMVPKLVTFQQLSTSNSTAAITAQQQKQLTVAATAYIQQNSTAIQSTATPTTPAIVTVAMLQSPAVNLLPASFSSLNPYGQTWQLQVLQPKPGNLQALAMSTGGTAVTDAQANRISAIVGAAGGVIPLNDSGVYPGGSTSAYGTAGGWTVSTSGYSSIAGGHPASLLTFNNNQLTSNYLYRNAVPGQPQLNQMNTALDMQNKNINNAGQVNAATVSATGNTTVGGTLSVSGTINAAGTITAGNVVVPAGNNLTVGSSSYYGDGLNSAVRQNGGFYIQHYDGSGARLSAGATDVSSLSNSGNMNTSGDHNTQGTLFTNRDSWSIISKDSGGNNNVSQQSAIGSANVNDAYFRSIGKWASQLSSIGDGQAWQDVTDSRTTYQNYFNYTGRTIMVNISIDSGSGGQIVGYMYVNDVRVASSNNNNNRYNNTGNFSALVPNGSYYSVSLSGANNYIPTWAELR
jgi:hypothetical protein